MMILISKRLHTRQIRTITICQYEVLKFESVRDQTATWSSLGLTQLQPICLNIYIKWAGAHRKVQLGMSSRWRLRSACASTQSDSKPSMSVWRIIRTLESLKRPAKTLIRLQRCAGWFESSLGTHTKVYFSLYPASNTFNPFPSFT